LRWQIEPYVTLEANKYKAGLERPEFSVKREAVMFATASSNTNAARST